MTEVERFLASHAPFGALDPEAIARAAASVVVEFFPEGEVILTQGGAPSRWIYLVRRGAVELVDGGRVVDLLEEGELFGYPSLLSQQPPAYTVRAREDTLCYLLPASVAHHIFSAPSGPAFLVASLRSRGGAFAPAPSLGALLTAAEAARSPLLVAAPQQSLAEVAAEMTRTGATAALVQSPHGWGIVTDRDMRARAVAARLPPATPVGEIVTAPVRVIPPDLPADQALLEMLDLGVHHLPVMAEGRPVAMLTDLDLLGLTRRDAFRLRSALDRAADTGEVARECRRLPEVAAALCEAGVDAEHVARMIATLVDAATRRLLQLAVEDLGAPPAPFAWLALGSGGRREQGLATDQDHALVHDGDEGDDYYYRRLAERVVAGLEAGGLPRCPSKVMASEEGWSGGVEWWRRRFRDWMEIPDRAATFLTGIVFDARPVAGTLQVNELWDEAVEAAAKNPPFLKRLGRLAVELRPPLGFLGNLVVEDTDRRQQVLDIKRGGLLPVTEIARLAALTAGSTEVGTRRRLQAAGAAATLDPDDAAGLGEAFAVFQQLRLLHQVEQWRRGEPPDNLLAPDRLNRLQRSQLKDAFGVVRHVQSALSDRLAPRVLGR